MGSIRVGTSGWSYDEWRGNFYPDDLDQGVLLQAPADTSADYFVLEVARDHDAMVVSNDRFEEYRDEHTWIEDRRMPFMVVRGEVHLYRPGENA